MSLYLLQKILKKPAPFFPLTFLVFEDYWDVSDIAFELAEDCLPFFRCHEVGDAVVLGVVSCCVLGHGESEVVVVEVV